MSHETEFVEDGIVVVQSAALRRKSSVEFAGVPGLDDEQAADPDELERQIYREYFGPILALPQRQESRQQWKAWDDGSVGFGAFGTIDFERLQPKFDKSRYKADKLREELRDLVIRLGLISERLPRKGRGLVLKYVRMGVLDLDEIVHDDMRVMARLYLRARRIRQEIRDLEDFGRKKRLKDVTR